MLYSRTLLEPSPAKIPRVYHLSMDTLGNLRGSTTVYLYRVPVYLENNFFFFWMGHGMGRFLWEESLQNTKYS